MNEQHLTAEQLRQRFSAGGLYNPCEEHDSCGIGLAADIHGKRSHSIVSDGCVILNNLTHRGAVGSDPETGDGAGLLLQIPDKFFRQRTSEIGGKLPAEGQYGAGIVFLPKNGDAAKLYSILESTIENNGCQIVGSRDVPTKPETVGKTARSMAPDVKQIFIANPNLDEMSFERRLYLIRRLAEKAVRASSLKGKDEFYISSLSCRTLVYKGMMIAEQLTRFYPDLLSEDMESAIAVVHQRYSTNTFPNWTLAQPFRMMCHNGEINTIRGNVDRRCNVQEILNGITAEEDTVWGKDIEKILPIFNNLDDSDSALFDNMFELLSLSGRGLAHAILMMIPEAWGDKYALGKDQRGFFEYHATFMEPWDGPAAMAFSDGRIAGSIVDRNGLRPARYSVLKNGRFILSSEAGVLPLENSDIVEKGCVSPGKMILVDTVQQRIIYNDEIKAKITRSRPYRRWVDANRIELARAGAVDNTETNPAELLKSQQNNGYTREELDLIIRPMFETGAEPVGAMGYDVPLAVLSPQPQLLFDYFKQRFAQVTNPPIDPIREKLLMSLTSFVGPAGSPFTEFPSHAHVLKIKTPVLTPLDLQQIFENGSSVLKAVRIDTTFDNLTPDGMLKAFERVCKEAENAVKDGAGILILSDKNTSAERAAIPSLLVSSGVGRFLMNKGIRSKTGLILESAEPRQVHHFAMLITCGLDAVCPYLAIDTIADTIRRSEKLFPMGVQAAVRNYISAVDKGLLKIFSKMGISTIRSYRYTLSCEAVGLNKEFIEKYFGPIPARIGGLGFSEVAQETLLRHKDAYEIKRGDAGILPVGGEHRNRRGGPKHLWDTESIALLQQAVRTNNQKCYDDFAERINHQEGTKGNYCTLRSLMDIDAAKCKPIPLAEVEPVESLIKHFMTGAMSFGALSREVHETMAAAMNRIGSMSNSGEGGEDNARYVVKDGINRNSETKQVASGRFGVTIEYLANAKELQIKMAQGAKPGEGGHLPGPKVNAEIGRTRNSTPGVSLISPPPHHDIYSIEDLAQLIFDLKNANPVSTVSVKLVSICGVGTIAAGVAKGKADMILISGFDGGTGASPFSSIKNAGVPWELGLSETQQTLVRNELRGRVRVQTDGQIRTGRDVAIAAMLGADEFGFGTGALVSLGCVLMRKCNANICPVGIATQEARLRAKFGGAPEHLINYFRFVAEELRQIMAQLGFKTLKELIGRSDLLKQKSNIENWKAKTVNLADVLAKPPAGKNTAVSYRETQTLDGVTPLMKQTAEDAKNAIETKNPVKKTYKVSNLDRSLGSTVSYYIAKKYGTAGLPEDTVSYTFEGTAGQSFGAFTAAGVTLHLIGEANDYVGKGLSGGKLIIQVPPKSSFDASQNIIAGKTLFYGATGGEAYINGRVAERFCVRNSGATVVVEGVGDHGCEYMTGGCVAVIGPTGVNFAAGMSGGIAYVYDPDQTFDLRCNLEMVDLEPMFLEEDINKLKGMIQKHYEYTKSAKAKELLDNWERTKNLFVKVIPMEYRAALGLTNPVDLQSRKTKEQQVFQA